MLTETNQRSPNRLFTGTLPDGTTATFLVHFVGKDGSNIRGEYASLWLGKMKKAGEPMVDVALAVADDGTIIAANLAAPEEAVNHSRGYRRAYGPSLKPMYNWRVTDYKGTKLEGYHENR